MEDMISAGAKAYIAEHGQELTDLLKALCAIPAPSGQEERRAAFVRDWFAANGAEEAYIDSALNVVFPYGCDGDREIVVFCAHTDTVFPDLSPMPLSVRDGRMYCPGVGDDTANLAVLMMIVKYVCRAKPTSPYGILFVANSGEEGLGNLKGTRKFMEVYGGRVREFISFDGDYREICGKAVGSQRYRIRVATEGGHSYGDFGNRNAIHRLTAIIQDLYEMEIPQLPDTKSTFNVGTIAGGTSVNTIAQSAEALFEFRSDNSEALEVMQRFFEGVIARHRQGGLDVDVELLGLRPGMGPVDPAAQQQLIDRAKGVLRRFLGTDTPTKSSSTDCNIPLSMGIPAVCFGLMLGEGAHTREEWIDLDSLQTGFSIGMAFVLDYFTGSAES